MILIKLATRGRPEWFKRAIRNIHETILTPHFRIVVSADENDSSMNNDDIKFFNTQFPKSHLIYGKSESKIAAINRDMDRVSFIPIWDILINMSDDMVFIHNGWDEVIEDDILKTWGNSTDWFAHYSDGYVESKLSTMSIMGYDYYKRFNYIYHPIYKSFSADAEAMYVAQMLGKWKYFGDDKVLFKHEHPANNKAIKNDEVYKMNSFATNHDIENYWKRLHKYFDIPESERKCTPFAEHLNTNIHWKS